MVLLIFIGFDLLKDLFPKGDEGGVVSSFVAADKSIKVSADLNFVWSQNLPKLIYIFLPILIIFKSLA